MEHGIMTPVIRSSRNNGNTNKEAKIKSGDIIVSNWTSYIDVLYLAYK